VDFDNAAEVAPETGEDLAGNVIGQLTNPEHAEGPHKPFHPGTTSSSLLELLDESTTCWFLMFQKTLLQVSQQTIQSVLGMFDVQGLAPKGDQNTLVDMQNVFDMIVAQIHKIPVSQTRS